MPTEPALRRIVLVGFMAAGKSAVGAQLARLLGWRHRDLDAWMVARAGQSVAEIFAARGEPEFRRLEGEATRAAARLHQVVISTGGGWVITPGHWRLLRDDAYFVWLRVRLDTALARAAREPGTRPLLEGADAALRARALLAEREPRYAAAQLTLDTDDLTAAEAAAHILQRVSARVVPS